MRLQALLVAFLIAAPAAAQPTSVSVRVLADSDGTPLRRVKVVAVGGGRAGEPAFSGDDGRVLAIAVGPGTVLQLSKAGYTPQSVPATASPTGALDIRLAKAVVITGRVIDSRGQPAVRVPVQVRRVDDAAGPFTPAPARTDDRGEFRLGSLAAGRFEVYVERGRGATSPPQARESESNVVAVTATAGEQLDVQLTQQIPSVEFPFSEGGVVTGTLVDEHGEPADGVGISLQSVGGAGVESTIPPAAVDDTGRFRIFHVPPGRYLMVVTSRPAPGVTTAPGIVRIGAGDLAGHAFLPVYFPGSLDPSEAEPLVIERAREVHGIDMVVPAVRGARVFGSVALPGARKDPILLRPAPRSAATVLGVPSATTTAQGTFELRNVPPGRYTLQFVSPAVYDRPSAVTEFRFAAAEVSVGVDDVGPIMLSPALTSTISGRIILEGERQGVAPQDFALTVLPVNPADAPDRRMVSGATMIAGGAEPDSNWTFRVAGLAGPSRIALSRAPRGWWLKAVRVGAVDAALEPADFGWGESRDDVEVILARSAGTVTGRAVGTNGRPLDLYTVVAFSPERDRWFDGSPYVVTTTSRSNGEFVLPSLAPGQYLIAAIEYSELDPTAEEVLRADSLARLTPAAQRLSVGEHQQQRIDLRLIER
jgi:hypothetical protein